MTKSNTDLYFEQSGKNDFTQRVRVNQQKLTSDLKTQYDFIVCGSGSSPIVARRLAENSAISLLLLEAGGDDDVPSVTVLSLDRCFYPPVFNALQMASALHFPLQSEVAMAAKAAHRDDLDLCQTNTTDDLEDLLRI
jgi:choline dehydrogenase-like flavoprotein